MYWNKFLTILKTYDPHNFCKHIKMCSNGKVLQNIDIGRDNCTPCKMLSSIFKTILQSPDILKMIKEGVKKACDSMPETLKNVCNSELQTHWNDFVRMLNNLNSEQFCKKVKMCSIWEELPIIEDGEKCESCKILAKMVKTILLISPDVAETIKNTILDTCGTMSPELRSVCDFAVKTFWNDLIEMLKTFDPHQLCQHIKMCSSGQELQNIDYTLDIYKSCAMLSNLMTTMKNADLTQGLRNTLNHMCNDMLPTIKDWCHNEIQRHWPEWINLIQKFDAENMCRGIELYRKFKEMSVVIVTV